uniref:Phytochrome kinase substrate-related family protein n=1 Tax=Rhizophora mucronata TaxID=61149 RepID=A0A2P2J0A3_RHIMU
MFNPVSHRMHVRGCISVNKSRNFIIQFHVKVPFSRKDADFTLFSLSSLQPQWDKSLLV